MIKTIPTNLLAGLILVASAASASAALIDDFTDGGFPSTSAPPSQQIDEAGLSGVIGFGDRRSLWNVQSGPGTADMDLNDAVPGQALLSTSAATVGFWAFIYGHNAPFDVDLTDGGLNNAFVVNFAQADVGTLSVTVFDIDGDVDGGSVPIPPLPFGGLVAVPFALIDLSVDLAHAKEVIIAITGVNAGDYQMNILNTQVVPEPASLGLGLMAAGFASLLVYRRRSRGA